MVLCSARPYVQTEGYISQVQNIIEIEILFVILSDICKYNFYILPHMSDFSKCRDVLMFQLEIEI